MRNPSLIRQFIRDMALLIVVFWLAAAGIAAYVFHYEVNEVLDSGLQETAQRLLPVVHLTSKAKKREESGAKDDDDDEDNAEHEEISADVPPHEEYIVYQVFDRDGQIILRSHDSPDQAWPAPAPTGFHDYGDWRIYAINSADGDLLLQVGERVSHRYSGLYDSLLGLVLPLLALLPASALFIRMIGNRGAKPVNRLGAELASRSEGNLSPLASDGMPEELQPLIQGTNRLMAQLKAALESERSFAGNSAHEMRTPVAAAQAQAQLLAQELGNSPGRERALKIAEALKRLSRLVEKLLQLSRAEAGVAMRRESVDLKELTSFLVREYERHHPTHKLNLTLQANGAAKVLGDSDMIASAIQNLLDNAIYHGTAGGPIEVRLAHDGRSLLIGNEGPVIPPDKLQRLTERFERGKGAGQGSGLGLAIVDTIMQQSGGALVLHSPAPGKSSGFAAELRFP